MLALILLSSLASLVLSSAILRSNGSWAHSNSGITGKSVQPEQPTEQHYKLSKSWSNDINAVLISQKGMVKGPRRIVTIGARCGTIVDGLHFVFLDWKQPYSPVSHGVYGGTGGKERNWGLGPVEHVTSVTMQSCDRGGFKHLCYFEMATDRGQPRTGDEIIACGTRKKERESVTFGGEALLFVEFLSRNPETVLPKDKQIGPGAGNPGPGIFSLDTAWVSLKDY